MALYDSLFGMMDLQAAQVLSRCRVRGYSGLAKR